jgi:lysophospholipase L1-like esterase
VAAVVLAAAGLALSGCQGTTQAQPAPKASPTATRASAAASPTPFVPDGPVVALGDSYTAGLLLPEATGSQPPGCFRSAISYPVKVASALHAKQFVNASCGSAGTIDMTSSQRTADGTAPPQLDALSADDSVVVLTLSGDDLGFSNVLHECMVLSFTKPEGSPCEAHYQGQLTSQIDAEGPKMATVLSQIRARAPRARLLLVGYPDLFPQSGGCWPAVPITNGDITFLRGAEQRLNTMLATVAAAGHATYVDTYQATIGHDFCQPEKTRDVEGLIPESATWSFHPNAKGQSAMAAQVLKALG